MFYIIWKQDLKTLFQHCFANLKLNLNTDQISKQVHCLVNHFKIAIQTERVLKRKFNSLINSLICIRLKKLYLFYLGNKNGFHFFVIVFYKERCLFTFVVFSQRKMIVHFCCVFRNVEGHFTRKPSRFGSSFRKSKKPKGRTLHWPSLLNNIHYKPKLTFVSLVKYDEKLFYQILIIFFSFEFCLLYLDLLTCLIKIKKFVEILNLR